MSACSNLSILEYKKEVYQSHYKSELISDFLHGPMTKGAIDSTFAFEIIDSLNSKNEGSPIHFDKKRLEKELSGGACSAIAFRVAGVAIESLEKLEKMPEDQKALLLKKNLDDVVDTINKEAKGEKKRHQLLRKQTRSIQAAFNTISIKNLDQLATLAQEKVASLASYFGLWRLCLNR